MTEETGPKIVRLVILGMLCMLLVTAYIFWTDYQGRKNTVEAVRKGCDRDRISRTLNAEGWRIAQDARSASGNTTIAIRYGELATELERLASINCKARYPEASLIP
jgi:hypothetical protein